MQTVRAERPWRRTRTTHATYILAALLGLGLSGACGGEGSRWTEQPDAGAESDAEVGEHDGSGETDPPKDDGHEDGDMDPLAPPPNCLELATGEDDGRDSDGDGLSDHEECMRYFSNPELVDSDGDGLDDGIEVTLHHTSPALPDTDADGWGDLLEVQQTTNPAVADVPIIGVEISSAPSLGLNAVETSEQTMGLSAMQASVNSASSSRQRTDASSTTTSMEHSAEISASMEVGYPSGATARVEASASFTEGYSETRSSSWTNSSARASEQTRQAAEQQESRYMATYKDGTILAGFDMINRGNRDVIVTDLHLTALLRRVGTEPRVIADLVPDSDEIQINALAKHTNLIADNKEVPAFAVKEALSHAEALEIAVSRFNLAELDAEGNVTRTFTTSGLATRTTVLVFDYGDGNVTRAMIATSLDRARGGILMADALAVLDLDGDYETAPDAEGVERLVRLGDRRGQDEPYRCRWFVSSSSKSLTAANDTRFDEILLQAGDVTRLVHVCDQDGDGLVDRVESALGTSATDVDSDGDGIEDGEEVTGFRHAPGFVSDPLSLDGDYDGLSDLAEYELGTDPSGATPGMLHFEAGAPNAPEEQGWARSDNRSESCSPDPEAYDADDACVIDKGDDHALLVDGSTGLVMYYATARKAPLDIRAAAAARGLTIEAEMSVLSGQENVVRYFDGEDTYHVAFVVEAGQLLARHFVALQPDGSTVGADVATGITPGAYFQLRLEAHPDEREVRVHVNDRELYRAPAFPSTQVHGQNVYNNHGGAHFGFGNPATGLAGVSAYRWIRTRID